MKNKKQSLASQYIEDINKRQAKAAVLRQTNKLLLAEHKDTLRLVSEIKATAKPIEQALQTSLSVLEQHQQVRTQLIEIDDSHPPELLQQQFHIAGIRYDADQQNKMLSDALVATDEDIQKITASSLSYWRQIESLKQYQIAMLDHADHIKEKLKTNKFMLSELTSNPDGLTARLKHLGQIIGTWLETKTTIITINIFWAIYVATYLAIYPANKSPLDIGMWFATAIGALYMWVFGLAILAIAIAILLCIVCYLANKVQVYRQRSRNLLGSKFKPDQLKLLQIAKPS